MTMTVRATMTARTMTRKTMINQLLVAVIRSIYAIYLSNLHYIVTERKDKFALNSSFHPPAETAFSSVNFSLLFRTDSC
jgi:hypothetical protein